MLLLLLLLAEKSLLSEAAFTSGILDNWMDFWSGRNDGETEENGLGRDCRKVGVLGWDWKLGFRVLVRLERLRVAMGFKEMKKMTGKKDKVGKV